MIEEEPDTVLTSDDVQTLSALLASVKGLSTVSSSEPSDLER